MSNLNENRVKFARHLLNYKAIEAELATYDLEALQKSANDGSDQETRIKYAALLRQAHVERVKVANLLGLLGSGIMGAGRFGVKQLNKVPKKVLLPAALAGGAYAGTQYDIPGAAKSTGEYASNLGSIPSDIGGGFYNALQRLLGKNPTAKKDPGASSRGFALRPSQRKPIYYRANKADL
jgi:hypothetical protein